MIYSGIFDSFINHSGSWDILLQSSKYVIVLNIFDIDDRLYFGI